MSILVLSFAVWGITQARAVSHSRAELEQRVGWLGGVQPALPLLHALPDSTESRRQWVEASSSVLSTLDEIDAEWAGLNTFPARIAILAIHEDAPSREDASTAISALTLLQTDIRGQTREISVRLSRYWSLLNILLTSTILVSLAGLGLLFVLLRRQMALALTHSALSGEIRRRAIATDALRTSEQALETILESIAEGIITVDDSGIITRLNAAAERIVGCQRLNVQGTSLSSTVEIRVDSESLDLSTARLQEGLVYYGTDNAVLHRADGTRVDIALFSAPLGGRPGALLLFRDITDEQAAEQERQQSERTVALSRLIAGISHGLNNPLTSLKSNIESLHVSADEDETLADMRAGVTQMVKILRQLSALSRVTPRQMERLDVGVLAEQVARIIAPEIAERARLLVDVQSAPLVVADRARLEQTLMGMVFNGAQSIPYGAPEDNTVTIQVTGSVGAVEVCVVDTGAGMVEAERVHVFDPFFSTRNLSTGFGLGLTYAHAEVTALHGRLSVLPADGGGTCVRITLPAANDPQAPPLLGGLRLLVIDDEATIISVVQRMLQDHFDTVGTVSGEEGLALLRAGSFDVALCDLMMPGLTGMQIHEALEKENPEMAIRMAFMTGGAFNEVSHAFLDAHETVCLTKPFTREDLVAVLGRAVERAGAR
ncbi:MAG: PAS domain S-box-containing protein [Myxococcota bacterium]|jgi:PAS domain S-box-containing protein